MAKMGGLTEKVITGKGGVKIGYRRLGSGKQDVMVFIHGLGGCAGAWEPFQRDLWLKGITSVAVDLRGHGKSGRPEKSEAYRIERLIDDVEEVIAHEQLVGPIVVGHCLGGMVSVGLAGRELNMGGLILVNTSDHVPGYMRMADTGGWLEKAYIGLGDRLPMEWIQERRDYSRFAGGSMDYSPSRIVDDIRHTAFKSYLYAFAGALNFDFREISHQLTIPVMILAGTRDSMIFPPWARKLRKSIPNAKLKWIKGGNHVMTLNHVEEMDREIVAFVQKLSLS